MKRDPEFFGEVELALVYIAKRLKDALKIEGAFETAGLDYLVEADSYRGGLIFQSERIGAFFYVAPEKEREAQSVLTSLGFQPYTVG